MNYKEKYEEALDNFKKIKAANKYNKELVNFIEYEYPELKESEDEKIRKNLREFLLDAPSQDIVSHHLDLEETLNWLEKQGKQKPTWSEEDEKIVSMLVSRCNGTTYTSDNLIKMKSWLKSLEERYTWKPSDEQIDVIVKIINSNTLDAYTLGMLQHLYQDLIKMKGE